MRGLSGKLQVERCSFALLAIRMKDDVRVRRIVKKLAIVTRFAGRQLFLAAVLWPRIVVCASEP